MQHQLSFQIRVSRLDTITRTLRYQSNIKKNQLQKLWTRKTQVLKKLSKIFSSSSKTVNQLTLINKQYPNVLIFENNRKRKKADIKLAIQKTRKLNKALMKFKTSKASKDSQLNSIKTLTLIKTRPIFKKLRSLLRLERL